MYNTVIIFGIFLISFGIIALSNLDDVTFIPQLIDLKNILHNTFYDDENIFFFSIIIITVGIGMIAKTIRVRLSI